MLRTHALTLAHARSHLAALADEAVTIEASIGYDRVLLQIDALHNDDVPALIPVTHRDRDVLFSAAEAAIENLMAHGVDALSVELALDALQVARDQDRL